MKIGLVVGCMVACCLTTQCVYAADVCDSTATLARSIMQARQSGVDMPEMMAVADKQCNGESGTNLKACAAAQRLQRTMIVAAYKTPMFSTREYRDREVSDFVNNWYLACYENEHKN